MFLSVGKETWMYKAFWPEPGRSGETGRGTTWAKFSELKIGPQDLTNMTLRESFHFSVSVSSSVNRGGQQYLCLNSPRKEYYANVGCFSIWGRGLPEYFRSCCLVVKIFAFLAHSNVGTVVQNSWNLNLPGRHRIKATLGGRGVGKGDRETEKEAERERHGVTETQSDRDRCSS